MSFDGVKRKLDTENAELQWIDDGIGILRDNPNVTIHFTHSDHPEAIKNVLDLLLQSFSR